VEEQYRKSEELPKDFKHQSATAESKEDQVPRVGRNEPCPCGSGKKYKHCHGKLA
jgi:preprotein translocase subunit SecA